jgi:hypothetical protein
MSIHRDRDLSLREDINEIMSSEDYDHRYATPQARELGRAVDILTRLQNATESDVSSVGFEKLRNAKLYLDSVLRTYFADQHHESNDHTSS